MNFNSNFNFNFIFIFSFNPNFNSSFNFKSNLVFINFFYQSPVIIVKLNFINKKPEPNYFIFYLKSGFKLYYPLLFSFSQIIKSRASIYFPYYILALLVKIYSLQRAYYFIIMPINNKILNTKLN